MLIRTSKRFIALMGLVVWCAAPAPASENHDEHDSAQESVGFAGDFNLDVLGDGGVEATIVIDSELNLWSGSVYSEDLDFGPLQEVEPGVWVAFSLAPDAAECFGATAELVFVTDWKPEHDDHDSHGNSNHAADDSHGSDVKASQEGEKAHHRGRHHKRAEAEKSFAIRLGASICAPSNVCENPAHLQQVPGLYLGPPPPMSPAPGLFF